jgi:hypothetical protein
MALQSSTQSNFRYYEVGFDKWVEDRKLDASFIRILLEQTPVCFFTNRTQEMLDAQDCTNKLKCRTCKERILTLMIMRDLNNKSILFPRDKDCYDHSLHALWEACQTGKITSSQVMNKQDFYSNEKGKFSHFSERVSLDDSVWPSVKNKKRISIKYFNVILNFFMDQGKPGTTDTSKLLIKNLEKVKYGDKLRESAIWFRTYIKDNFNELSTIEKHKIVYSAMFNQPCAFDKESNDAILIHYDQFKNNTLDALEVSDDLEKLTNLLQSRLNPKKYGVKTAPPTEKQVSVAIKHIGDFTVRLMLANEAIKMLNGVTINHGVIGSTSSSKAISNMSVKSKSKKSNSSIANFGQKINSNYSNINTIQDLLHLQPSDLEINITNLSPCYINVFDGLKKGIYKYDYTWGFDNGKPFSKYSLVGIWHKVTGIVKIGEQNYVFLLKDSKPSPKMDVCCHACLLTPDYKKTLEQVWGNLKNSMQLIKPSNGEFAIGAGVSCEKIEEGSEPRLRQSIKFRIGDKVINIK